jgi:hypothetical protein
MAVFEQYHVTPLEMGLDASFEATEETLALFVAHVKAKADEDETFKAFMEWRKGRSGTNFTEEDCRLLYKFGDAEHEMKKTYKALQIAVFGIEAWRKSDRGRDEAAEEDDRRRDLGRDEADEEVDEEDAEETDEETDKEADTEETQL